MQNKIIKPRYPVYIVSKGRYDNNLTAKFMIEDDLPFKIVIEPQEEENYAKKFGKERLLILPFKNLGLGSIPARNWIWEHSIKSGFERHWIFDDNIRYIQRLWRNKRIRCNSNIALTVVEDFVDRYENIAVAGLNYSMFGIVHNRKLPPFYLNCHVYSSLLIMNKIPNRWRGRYNEDTDLCLQVLADGWCTISTNIFLSHKMRTMTMKGGNNDILYKGSGRLKMARSLERVWPGVVTVKRKFKRPQHHINGNWTKFNTPLKLKEGISIKNGINEYGMELQIVKEIKSKKLKSFIEENKK